MRLPSRCQPRLQSFGGSPRTTGSASKMPYCYGWRVGTSCWHEASFTTVTSLADRMILRYGSGLVPSTSDTRKSKAGFAIFILA